MSDVQTYASLIKLMNSLVVLDSEKGVWLLDVQGRRSGQRGNFKKIEDLLNAISVISREDANTLKSAMRQIGGGDQISELWEDLRVPMSSLLAGQVNNPTLGRVTSATPTVVGKARSFNGGSSTASADSGHIDLAASFSVGLWFHSLNENPTDRQTLIWKTGDLNIYLRNDRIYVKINGLSGELESGSVYLGNARNCLVVTVEEVGAETEVSIWLNGNLVAQENHEEALPSQSANDFYFGTRQSGGREFTGYLDEIRFWQAVLTPAQISEFYNTYNGTEAALTGTPTLTAGYHLNETSGTTGDNYEGTATYDMTLANTTIVDGLITTGSTRGVFAWLFDYIGEQELWFSVQMPHGWKEGSTIYPHVHWTPIEDRAGDEVVKWGLEYTVAKVGGTFPEPTIISSSDLKPDANDDFVALNHLVTGLGSIDMTGMELSAMLMCRIFRDNSVGDNHPHPVALMEFDFHYQIDAAGSLAPYDKTGTFPTES